ncbi:hypothetical protein GCM10009719_34100 [Nocardioides kribbensis]
MALANHTRLVPQPSKGPPWYDGSGVTVTSGTPSSAAADGAGAAVGAAVGAAAGAAAAAVGWQASPATTAETARAASPRRGVGALMLRCSLERTEGRDEGCAPAPSVTGCLRKHHL